MTSMSPDAPQVSAAGEIMKCEAGDTWRWDGVDFDILIPPPPTTNATASSPTTWAVLKVSVGGKSLLLTADIESSRNNPSCRAMQMMQT